MKKPILPVLLLVMGLFASAFAGRNIVIIGSEVAPVKYLRGTGSNVGLYVGIDLQPGAITFQNQPLAKTSSFLRPAPLGYGRGNNYTPGGGAQGMGKRKAVATQSPVRHAQSGHRILSHRSLKKMHSPVLAKTSASSGKISFQLLPFYWFNIPAGASSTFEVLMPVLCQNQFADAPNTTASSDFTVGKLHANSAKTYVGVYRIDQYLNDHIAGNILSDGNSFLYDPSEVSEWELLLISESHLTLDSSSTDADYPGFYYVRYLYLEPQEVNFALWAALDNQGETACREGLNHIRETNSLPPVSDSEAVNLYYFNHIVFAFAQMPDLQAKFRSPPGGTIPEPPDLRPYAIIEWSPDSADIQNRNGGVRFSSTYSFDADGGITRRKWEFGDGAFSDDSVPLHEFEKNGNYIVRLRVTDDAGNESRDSITIKISSAATVQKQFDRGNKGVHFNQAGNRLFISGDNQPQNGNVRIESFNIRGQRIFNGSSQAGPAENAIDLHGKMTDNVVIWRCKDGKSGDTERSVLLRK